jgi:regulatory protein
MGAGHAKAPPSILQRAVALLARREHSRAELTRKLTRFQSDNEGPLEIEAALDQLEAKGMLSNERFVTAMVRNRGERFGASRISQELRQHGIDSDLMRQSIDQLKQTELERARGVWRKKFGVRARNDVERARQIRFMTARGFAPDVILRVVKGVADAD